MTTIPQTADGFKAWAERECGKWPADLQMKAYDTSLRFRMGHTKPLAEFTESYCQWEASQS